MRTPSLTTRTLRGFAWAFTGSTGQAVVQIAATIVLARLLTPEQFGSVAAALLIVGLAQLLTQLGVSAALVQRQTLSDEDVLALAGRPMIGFGSGYSLAQLGNWAAQNADNLVVAGVLGTGPLGVYSRAYNLLSEPAAMIGGAGDKVLFPAMARVREDGERLRAAYVRSASLIALVTAPASVMLFVLAPEVVRVLLGPR